MTHALYAQVCAGVPPKEFWSALELRFCQELQLRTFGAKIQDKV
jgi:hypothetical protein